jgi:hypothetical protein
MLVMRGCARLTPEPEGTPPMPIDPATTAVVLIEYQNDW